MTLKQKNARLFLNLSLLLFTLASIWLNPSSALAMGDAAPCRPLQTSPNQFKMDKKMYCVAFM